MIPTGIVLHHSLTPDGSAADWGSIKKYHTSYRYNGEIITRQRYNELARQGITRGLEQPWADIGYHAGIERINGVVTTLTGRDIDIPGAHCVGRNDHLGLCIVGNYDLAPPDDELLQAAAALCRAWLCMFPHITPDHIYGHYQFAHKTCPGARFPWDRFRGMIHE